MAKKNESVEELNRRAKRQFIALTEVARYLFDREQQDYIEWCEIEGLDPKDFLAPDQRRHIFSSVLVVSGYKKGDYPQK